MKHPYETYKNVPDFSYPIQRMEPIQPIQPPSFNNPYPSPPISMPVPYQPYSDPNFIQGMKPAWDLPKPPKLY